MKRIRVRGYENTQKMLYYTSKINPQILLRKLSRLSLFDMSYYAAILTSLVDLFLGRRVCFKEQFDNGKCFAPIRESLIERPSQFISGDCCLFSNAMYYANTNASEAQIRFFGVQCSQCTKNQTGKF